MGQTATIQSIQDGKFYIKNETGELVELKAGDKINLNDKIISDNSNTQTSKLELLVDENNQNIAVIQGDFLLDSTLFESTFSNEETAFTSKSVEEILEAYNQASQDLDNFETAAGDVTEQETAAGDEIAEDGGALRSRFSARDGDSTDIVSDLREVTFNANLEENIQGSNNAPIQTGILATSNPAVLENHVNHEVHIIENEDSEIGETPTTPPAGGETPTTPPAGGETPTTPPAGGETPTTPPAGGETPTTPPAGGETPTTPPAGSETPTTPPAGSETPTTPPAGGETPTTPPAGGETPTTPPAGGETPTTPPAGSGDNNNQNNTPPPTGTSLGLKVPKLLEGKLIDDLELTFTNGDQTNGYKLYAGDKLVAVIDSKDQTVRVNIVKVEDGGSDLARDNVDYSIHYNGITQFESGQEKDAINYGGGEVNLTKSEFESLRVVPTAGNTTEVKLKFTYKPYVVDEEGRQLKSVIDKIFDANADGSYKSLNEKKTILKDYMEQYEISDKGKDIDSMKDKKFDDFVKYDFKSQTESKVEESKKLTVDEISSNETPSLKIVGDSQFDFSKIADIKTSEIDLGKGNGTTNLLNIKLEDVLKMKPENSDKIVITIKGDANDKVSFADNEKANWTKTAGEGEDAGYEIFTNSQDPSVILRVEQPISDGITS